MIRFRFDPGKDSEFAYGCFAIEGDNTHGYVLLAYNVPDQADDSSSGSDGFGDEEEDALQLWFETLADALSHCRDDFGIRKDEWYAPSDTLPKPHFVPPRRIRHPEDSHNLNANKRGDTTHTRNDASRSAGHGYS